MISAMSKRFDVPVKHRARTASAHGMPGSMHVEPFSGGLFAAAELVANASVKNLGASTGNGAQPGFSQNFKRVAKWHFKNSMRQMTGFDRCECLDMQMRIQCPKVFQQIEIPIFFQARMQSTDHVHFGH